MKKKLIALFLAMTLCVSAFTACSSDKSGKEKKETVRNSKISTYDNRFYSANVLCRCTGIF